MDKRGERSKVVLDASVVAKWAIPGERWEEKALDVKARVVSGELEAYAPSLLVYELASVMLRALRESVLKPKDVLDALKAIGSIGIELLRTSWEEAEEVLKIARDLGLSVYDSAYIWASRKVGGKLITADEELKRKGGDGVLLLKEFSL